MRKWALFVLIAIGFPALFYVAMLINDDINSLWKNLVATIIYVLWLLAAFVLTISVDGIIGKYKK